MAELYGTTEQLPCFQCLQDRSQMITKATENKGNHWSDILTLGQKNSMGRRQGLQKGGDRNLELNQK